NLTMIGRSLLRQNRFDEAVEVLNEALTIRERVYGKVHPAVASTVNELGSIALQRAQYAEAEAEFRRMIDISATVYKDKHYLIGIAQSNLASIFLARGDNRDAESLFRQAIAMYEARSRRNTRTSALPGSSSVAPSCARIVMRRRNVNRGLDMTSSSRR
ncbi:MAG: tetratricopeptide repeat protein, partial [Bryobacteraceae bacterium]